MNGITARATRIALLVGFVCFVVWASFRIGQAWGGILELSRLTFGHDAPTRTRSAPFSELPLYERLSIATTEALGLDFLTDGQDKWITQVVFPGVSDGYYVDVGSGDGVFQSNTKMLDDRGWDGICIDPFPTNMETRTAKVFEEVVYNLPGHVVRFRASGFIGGIDDHLRHTRDWEGHQKAPMIELVTTTLDEILSRANAPRYIHYLSLDIEGAELEALQGLSFARFKVGALTVEHNWEQLKRRQIRSFLEENGYHRVLSYRRDDYFLHADLLKPGGSGF